MLLLLLLGSFLLGGISRSTLAFALGGTMLAVAVLVAFLASGAELSRVTALSLFGVGLGSLVLEATSSPGKIAFGIGAIGGVVISAAMLATVLGRVLRHSEVTAQTLFGAACAYMLIGLAFSSIFAVCDAVSSQPIFGQPVQSSVYGYFSFVTMTTVGYGDYTAKVDLVRRIAVTEAMLGQLFLATTVARLVSLYRGGGWGSRPVRRVRLRRRQDGGAV